MRVAAVQLNSTGDKARNLAAAERAGRAPPPPTAPSWSRCRRSGTCWPPARSCSPAPSRSTAPASTAARGWARELGIHLLAGSISRARRRGRGLQHLGADRPRRRGPRRLPQDPHVRRRRRRRLLPRVRARAAGRRDRHRAGRRTCSPGSASVTTCASRSCYRILALRGARLLTVPSAFTAATGRDHWEVLLRARAIENQAFVLAPNQVGEAPPHFDSYGHSAIVDPWGVVLALRSRRGVLRRRRPRPRRAGAGPRVAALARQPPTRRLRLAAAAAEVARLMAQSARPSTSAARSSTRRSASSPARASTRPASPTSPTRPASPTGSSTTTSAPRTRSSTSSSSSAGRCCWRRSRRPTGRDGPRRAEAGRGRRLHRRLLPPRPGADEGDHRRGDPRRQLLRPHPPAGDPPRLRVDRQDRRRRPEGGRLPPRHRADVSPRCPSTARSSSCSRAGSST